MNCYRNDYDWFVAENLEDLKTIALEYGHDEFDPEDWHELDPEGSLTISYETAEDCPGQALIEEKNGRWYATMRIKDWIELNGRGFLCSTEW